MSIADVQVSDGAYVRHSRVSRMLLAMRYCLEKLGE